jgi:hypothetical protein
MHLGIDVGATALHLVAFDDNTNLLDAFVALTDDLPYFPDRLARSDDNRHRRSPFQHFPNCDVVVSDEAAATAVEQSGFNERMETVVLSRLADETDHL